MIYNDLEGIFTTMIGFVTWPPLCTIISYKGGQVTKPIIVVKMLSVYHSSKRIFNTKDLTS